MRLNVVNNAKKGVIWGTIFKIVSLFLPFVIRTLLIKRLGSEYAGLNSLFTSVLQVLSLAELGFGTALTFSMYKPIANDDYKSVSAILKYLRRIYAAIGFVVLIVGFILTPFIPYLISFE